MKPETRIRKAHVNAEQKEYTHTFLSLIPESLKDSTRRILLDCAFMDDSEVALIHNTTRQNVGQIRRKHYDLHLQLVSRKNEIIAGLEQSVAYLLANGVRNSILEGKIKVNSVSDLSLVSSALTQAIKGIVALSPP